MQEIIVTLRFNRPCLGAAKRKKNGQAVFCFDRDYANRVLFTPAAWLAAMRYAAKLLNRHHTAVKKIDWCPVVEGAPPTDWRRTIAAQAAQTTRTHYAAHEAFTPGAAIILSAVIPDEISPDEFKQLLIVVGKYRGFSPFNNLQDKYGAFEVISVAPLSGTIAG